MNIITGTRLCGFTVGRVRQINELHATLVEMQHDKTGAELCWMDSKEQNKLFSVAFKTLPEDSTGVFHILEHSVLCGSEKYPVKDPFAELLRSSMNTFLNAMTYPDKTLYPVSSRNEKDFLNLTSVYLDAVFAPLLRKNPNIFYQEGWHTESEGGKLSYKGVVLNEMKGAMSSVDSRIEHGMESLLFPDNCYRFNSGGDPSVIPNLTYEQFVDTYQRFYQPSNARFFLDGDIPLNETLTMINDYLGRYERSDMQFELPMQNPVSNEGTGYYEISEEEDAENSAILSFGKIIGTWEDKEYLLAAQVLCDILAGSNESPLKREILSSGLAEDMEMEVVDGIAQPYLMVIVRNMADSDSGKIRSLIRETAERLFYDGLDRDSLTASVNRLEFRLRQIPEPQGLYRAVSALNSWIYGGDPLLYLVYDEAIAALRRMAENGGFEELLRGLLMDEKGIAVLHTLPSVTLGQEEREAEEKRLQEKISSLTEEQFASLLHQNEGLSRWQKLPDPPELLLTLPVLPLNEVSDTPELTETAEKTVNGVTFLYHPVSTCGIIHLSMYFPLTHFNLSELTKLSLLPTFLGKLPTEKHDAAELQKAIKTYIGQLSFGVEVFSRNNQKETCTPCLTVRTAVLEENLSVAEALLGEILTQTRFDQPDRIREIVMQNDEMSRQMAIGNGHSLAIAAVRAHYTAQAAVNEALNGYTFLKFLHNFAKNFDAMAETFISFVQRAKEEAICKEGLTVSVTSSREVSITSLLSALPQGKASPKNAAYRTDLPVKMGIRIPAQTAFAVKGYHLSCCGMNYAGSLRVAANILSLSYLWNAVRVQGGAYGAGLPALWDGSIFCYSYRDPSPSRSLIVYDSAADFLRRFSDSAEDLDKFIISAAASTEPLRMPAEQGFAADEQWFAGITNEDRKNTRRQILGTDRRSLSEWCYALEKMSEEGAVCVVGHDSALCECEDLIISDL